MTNLTISVRSFMSVVSINSWGIIRRDMRDILADRIYTAKGKNWHSKKITGISRELDMPVSVSMRSTRWGRQTKKSSGEEQRRRQYDGTAMELWQSTKVHKIRVCKQFANPTYKALHILIYFVDIKLHFWYDGFFDSLKVRWHALFIILITFHMVYI